MTWLTELFRWIAEGAVRRTRLLSMVYVLPDDRAQEVVDLVRYVDGDDTALDAHPELVEWLNRA